MTRNVRRQNAVPVIVASPTIKAAAATMGVAEKTVYRWLQDPDFKDELQRAQDSMAREAARAVTRAAVGALSVLEGIMSDTDKTPGVRIAAARTILEQAIRVYGQEGDQRRQDAMRSSAPVIIVDDIRADEDG